MPEAEDTFPTGFEWDERKRQINLAKHGVDFARAARVFDGRVVEWVTGEATTENGVGWFWASKVTWCCSWCILGARKGRLISATKASADERKAYYAAIPSRPR